MQCKKKLEKFLFYCFNIPNQLLKEEKMTRSDIIKKLYQHKSNLLLRDIEKIVDIISETISSSLADGHRIELRGFGVFAPKQLASKLASNPKGGAKINLPERVSVKFKAGKLLSNKINHKI